MNREILFRGKRVDNGEWVYGHLLLGTTICKGRAFICPDFYAAMVDGGTFVAGGFIEVDPSTVGQYTGLTDKNGRKIFEGDVVKVTDETGMMDFSDGGVGDISFFDGMWYIAGDVQNDLYGINDMLYIEVIGSIHDNLELVGGAE